MQGIVSLICPLAHLQSILQMLSRKLNKRNLCNKPNFAFGTLFLHPKNKQVLIAGCMEERQILVCHVISLQGKKKTQSSLFSAAQQWGPSHCSYHANWLQQKTLVISSTCLVFERQDKKHVAIKLCIYTTDCIESLYYAQAKFLHNNIGYKKNYFCGFKHKTMTKHTVKCAAMSIKSSNCENINRVRRCRDARLLFKSKLSNFQRWFHVQGIKTFRKERKAQCSSSFRQGGFASLSILFFAPFFPSTFLFSSCGLGEPQPWIASRDSER